jgi:hypothetical protein
MTMSHRGREIRFVFQSLLFTVTSTYRNERLVEKNINHAEKKRRIDINRQNIVEFVLASTSFDSPLLIETSQIDLLTGRRCSSSFLSRLPFRLSFGLVKKFFLSNVMPTTTQILTLNT